LYEEEKSVKDEPKNKEKAIRFIGGDSNTNEKKKEKSTERLTIVVIQATRGGERIKRRGTRRAT